MNLLDEFSDLSSRDLHFFRRFCEKAVAMENPLGSTSIDDVITADQLSETDATEFGQSIIALMGQGYLQRAGLHRYAITLTGFESYARAYIDDYDRTKLSVQNAVATLGQTDTNAIVASTGELRYLVNHVLRLLQRDRNIGAFVAESNTMYVTRVSARFQGEQSLRTLE